MYSGRHFPRVFKMATIYDQPIEKTHCSLLPFHGRTSYHHKTYFWVNWDLNLKICIFEIDTWRWSVITCIVKIHHRFLIWREILLQYSKNYLPWSKTEFFIIYHLSIFQGKMTFCRHSSPDQDGMLQQLIGIHDTRISASNIMTQRAAIGSID